MCCTGARLSSCSPTFCTASAPAVRAKPGAGPRHASQELGLTNARHDLVCVHLHDPRESTLPPAGLLTIEDAETGELLEVDSSRAAVREKFAATNAERLAELDRALRRAGVDTLRFSTAEPFAQTLQRSSKRGAGGEGDERPKSEGRRRVKPKSEGRRPKEIRSPKSETRSALGLTQLDAGSLFGFRASAFFRPSDFGLRISLALLSCSPPPAPPSPPPTLPALDALRAASAAWRNPTHLLGTARRVDHRRRRGLLLALVALAVWWLTRPKPPVVVPPEVQARQALEPLRQQAEDGAVLSQVSQILRHYVSAAFALPPGE